MILADAGVLVDFLRTKDPKLDRLFRALPVAVCGSVGQEDVKNLYGSVKVPDTLLPKEEGDPWDRSGCQPVGVSLIQIGCGWRLCMTESALDKWDREFRAAARADNYAILRDHLRRIGLPDKPELLLEGTILVIRSCSQYATVDNRDDEFDELLQMQTYNPAEAKDARYAFSFDVFGKAYARVLVETKVQTLDLADLYGSPWSDYQVVGFHYLWISHPDWSKLTSEEMRQLEDQVTNDLRFDYSENELDFWFDDSEETYLFVTVQDVYESEDDGED